MNENDTPCPRCECHCTHYPRVEWESDSDTDCCTGRDTNRTEPCDDFTVYPGRIALQRLAEQMIKLCPGDIYTWNKDDHFATEHCDLCSLFEDRTCPARKWLEQLRHPNAWEIRI